MIYDAVILLCMQGFPEMRAIIMDRDITMVVVCLSWQTVLSGALITGIFFKVGSWGHL